MPPRASVLLLNRRILLGLSANRLQWRLSPALRHSIHSRSSRPPPRWTRAHTIFAATTTTTATTLAFSLPALFPSSRGKEELVHNLQPDVPKTTEQQMLEASELERKEAKRVSKDQPKRWQALQGMRLFVVNYIVEPIATGVRFMTLVAIFVPVIVTIPVVWFGMRHEGGTTHGTIWWYGFLVNSLERAGPTFIKVGLHECSGRIGGRGLGGKERIKGEQC